MKKSMLILASVFLSLFMVFITRDARAIGLGLYGNASYGKFYWERSVSEYRFGGGFMYDTNCAGDYLFNYRLTFGVGYIVTDYVVWRGLVYIPLSMDRKQLAGGDAIEISMSHTFGFGLYRSKLVRLWMGPELLLFGYAGKVSGFTVGIGLALGVNINIGELICLSFSGSGRFRGGYRTYTYTYNADYLDSNLVYLSLLGGDEEQANMGGYGGEGTIHVAVLFRINDTYKKKK